MGKFDLPTGSGPTGIAIVTVGTTKYLYVAEHETGVISRFNLGVATPTREVISTGTFSKPDGIAADASGNLYIADRALHKVIRISATGAVQMEFGTGVAGTASGQFAAPLGVAVAGSAVYVTEHGIPGQSNGNRVQKFTISGTTATPVTTGWPVSGFNVPYGISVDIAGNVLVADGGNSTVKRYSSAGTLLGTLGDLGSVVTWVHVTAGGTVYTSQTNNSGGNNLMKRFATFGGSPNMTWGGDGGGNGQFLLAFAIAVDGDRAYVSDYGNNRVQTFDLSLPPGGGGSTDTTAPTATITANSSTATANSVTFTVSFNESVTGGSASSFTAGGTATGVSIASVTPSAATATTSYTVTVNFTGTSGTVTLGTSAAATTAIKDGSNNFYAGGAATATYTIPASPPPPPAGDTTAPIINSFELTSVNSTNSTAVMTVTFSEPVTGVDVGDFASTTTGTATVSDVSVSGSGATYNVNFTFGGTNGSLQFGIRTSGTGIVDAAGNAFAGAGVAASAPAGANPIGEMVLPTVTGIVAGTPASSTVNFTVTFSEAVTGFDRTDVLVSVPSTATATVGTVTGSGTTWTVPVSYTGSGEIRLTVIGGVTSNIRDTATNWYAGGMAAASTTFAIPSSGGGGGSAPVITSTLSRTVTANAAFSYTITASNSPTSFTATGLPSGLTFTSPTISGSVATAGTYNITIGASNASGSDSKTLVLTVNPASSGGSAPVITSTLSRTVTANAAFSYTITASNSPTSFTATGLPANLTFTSPTISGSVTAAGTYNITIGAANASGSDSKTLVLTVNPASGGGTPADTTPPQPSSFIKSSHTATTATFTLTFNEAVVGVDASDFIITKSGTINPAIASVTAASGTTWNIGTTYTGSGSFYLTLKGSGTGIADTAGNQLTSSAISSSFSNVTTTPPPPPPSSPPPVFFPPPPVVTPPVVKTNQTVTFVSPVSALLVNQSIALSATASSGLPVTFTLVAGNATLSGNTLTLRDTSPVVVRASQAGSATVNPASTDVTFTAQRTAQQLNVPAMSTRLTTDGTIVLSATSDSGLPISYSVVSGPATVSGTTLTLTGRPGEVVLNVTQAGNDSFLPVTSQLRFNVDPAARLVNLSSRMNVSNDQPVIVGFVASGTTEKQVLIRAVGPGLTAFGVSGALSNPRLQLFDGNGRLVAENDDWTGSDVSATADRVGAFRLTANSRDAAVVARLAPGAYTAVVTGVNSNGVVLIEVYDGATREQIATQQLVNISTRGFVGSDQDSLIAGFVVTGSAPKRVLVRGIGPSLTQFGVTGAVSNPMLRIVAAGSDAALAQNDNWATPVTVDSRFAAATATDISTAGLASGAFPLNAGSNDAAIVISLEPGNYSAVMSGANNATGTGLIEVYELPNP